MSRELPEEFEDPLRKYHIFNKYNLPVKTRDHEIREAIKAKYPLMVIGSTIYIYDQGVFRPDPSGTILKSIIAKYIYPDLITSNVIRRIYEYFLMDTETAETIDTINQYPPEWVHFKNGFYDPLSDTIKPHDPKYKAINIIPFPYFPDVEPEGQEIDKWLNGIIPDPDDQEMLLQYCGLCMTRDTRFQKSLFLTGNGGTGKSTIINFISEVIGFENISSITLEQLNQRFYPAQLLGKLLNTCADLKTSILNETDGFKKITGEDRLMCEHKKKEPFFFNSYAKLLFSVNEMPTVKGENTDGFYRRLLIIRLKKEIESKDPELLEKLKKEIPYFLNVAMYALRVLYEQKAITESPNSREEVQKLQSYSDSVYGFLAECCNTDRRCFDWLTARAVLYDAYKEYCSSYQRQAMSNQNFYRSLENKGFKQRRKTDGRFFEGIIYPANRQLTFTGSNSKIDITGNMTTF